MYSLLFQLTSGPRANPNITFVACYVATPGDLYRYCEIVFPQVVVVNLIPISLKPCRIDFKTALAMAVATTQSVVRMEDDCFQHDDAF